MLCLEEWGWEPSKFSNLPIKEKAVTVAMIDDIIRRRNEAMKKK